METTRLCLACNREFAPDTERCPADGTMLIILKTEEISDLDLSKYEPEAFLARGRYTLIWKVRRKSDQATVVIKAIQQQPSEIIQRYVEEARTLKRLAHPNIVSNFGLYEPRPGSLHLELSYAGAWNCLAWLKTSVVLPYEQVRSIVAQVCDALQCLEAAGIVHPNLKTSHIVMSDDQTQIMLVDFAPQYVVHPVKTFSVGASIMQDGEYAAPEIIVGKTPTAATNIYALGCIAYELLTGAPPFVCENQLQLASKQMSEKAPPLPKTCQAPKSAADVIKAALEKEPEKRPSALEFKAAFC